MALSSSGAAPLSLEQLEAGLLVLAGGADEVASFRDQKLTAFRETLRVAIRDTSDALRTPALRGDVRSMLQEQVHSLRLYAALADRYLAKRAGLGGMAQPSGVFPDRLQ